MNILTFDIEEWFAYQRPQYGNKEDYLPRLECLLGRLLEDLEMLDVKATFFCLGAVARDYPKIIKLIHNNGHEIACHSDQHIWLTNFTPEQFEYDTKIAIDSLEQVIGSKITSYRAPAFSIGEQNKWTLEVLVQNGIKNDASIFPSNRDFGGFPSFSTYIPCTIKYNGIEIREFPIGIANLWGQDIAYSGGGYFRLVPYWFIKKLSQNNDYTMSYFHLRDFDVDQKRDLKFSLRYFKSYYGINKAYEKFHRYVNDFKFIDIQTANNQINWGNSPIIEL